MIRVKKSKASKNENMVSNKQHATSACTGAKKTKVRSHIGALQIVAVIVMSHRKDDRTKEREGERSLRNIGRGSRGECRIIDVIANGVVEVVRRVVDQGPSVIDRGSPLREASAYIARSARA